MHPSALVSIRNYILMSANRGQFQEEKSTTHTFYTLLYTLY